MLWIFAHVRTLPTQHTASHNFLWLPQHRLDIAVYCIDTLQYDAYCSTSRTSSCDVANVNKMLQIVKQYEKKKYYCMRIWIPYDMLGYSFVQLCRLRTTFGGILREMEQGFILFLILFFVFLFECIS